MPKKIKPLFTFEDAFADLFSTVIVKRNAHRMLGVSSIMMRKIRNQYRKGKLSATRKRSLLAAAGYKVVQPEMWM